MKFAKPEQPIIIEHPFVHDATNAMEEPTLYDKDLLKATARDLHERVGPDFQVVLRATRRGHWRFSVERLGSGADTTISESES